MVGANQRGREGGWKTVSWWELTELSESGTGEREKRGRGRERERETDELAGATSASS